MKKILGLDLGTNSIGWAIIEKEDNKGRIIKSGSRIIPMDAATLGDFATVSFVRDGVPLVVDLRQRLVNAVIYL